MKKLKQDNKFMIVLQMFESFYGITSMQRKYYVIRCTILILIKMLYLLMNILGVLVQVLILNFLSQKYHLIFLGTQSLIALLCLMNTGKNLEIIC
jgi:hypothetical protein